jgi:hypothetical protein
MDIRIYLKRSMILRSSFDDFAEIRRMNEGSAKVQRRIVEGRHLINVNKEKGHQTFSPLC